jgi:hypothetical protein
MFVYIYSYIKLISTSCPAVYGEDKLMKGMGGTSTARGGVAGVARRQEEGGSVSNLFLVAPGVSSRPFR